MNVQNTLHSSFSKKVRVTWNQGTPGACFKRQWKGSEKMQAWSTISRSKFLSSSFVQKIPQAKTHFECKGNKKLLLATNQLEHKGDRNREEKKGEGEKK